MRWRLFRRSGESKQAREQREQLEKQFAADSVAEPSVQPTREQADPGTVNPPAPGQPSEPDEGGPGGDI